MDILNNLENKYKVTLPIKYKEWFKNGGPYSESFIGTDMDQPYLPELMGWAIQLLNENNVKTKLPNNSFVFAMHQGYQFMYFICNGSDDPEIWYYHEGDKEPYIKWTSFSDFIKNT